MTKREEFNIKFYKRKDPSGHTSFILDTQEAKGEKKRLGFIDSLYPNDIRYLITTLHEIENGEPYDEEFLSNSEVYQVFDVAFSDPNFSVGGAVAIHREDLKQLLHEWFAFIIP